MSRYLTHMKKLRDPAEPLARFFDRARPLGEKLGPVLYQLPPGWKADLARLENFVKLAPRDVPQAIEFRDVSWYTADVFALLNEYGIALCLHDMAGSETGFHDVGPFVYVRFHGSGQKYGGGYSSRSLGRWAEWLNTRLGAGTPVYAYFNNDVGGHAPRDAMKLRDRLRNAGAVRERRRA
jgi:uncharacterized protein YecE (DUF72 family)